jgi:hypothetical protein
MYCFTRPMAELRACSAVATGCGVPCASSAEPARRELGLMAEGDGFATALIT